MNEEQEQNLKTLRLMWSRNEPVFRAFAAESGLSMGEVILLVQMDIFNWMLHVMRENGKRVEPILTEAERQLKQEEDWR